MNNAAINDIKNMLNVRMYGDELAQESRSQAARSVLAADMPMENLKPLQDFIREHGIHLSGSIESTMENLQDIFVAALHEHLQEAGISADIRFVLNLSENGQLFVEGNTAMAEALQKMLDDTPSLSILFQQIRARAVILQGIEDIQSGLDVCFEPSSQGANSLFAVYKICIKGPLSHFYLQ